MFLKRCFWCLLMVLLPFVSYSQKKLPGFINPVSYHWADSVLDEMTVDEKIGQLFMVQMQSVWPEKDLDSLESLIRNYHLGGLIVFKGGPYRQALCINRMQQAAKIPLLVSIDGEWGLSMRMDSTIRFPRQMTLSAIHDDSLLSDAFYEIASQCKRMGIQLNFAPDIDINNNPQNPVINTRSFSDDKFEVAEGGILYMQALQNQHVLACGKHFPGHGDTDTDSHYALPVINKSANQLDTLEWFPFRQLIKNGVSSIMTGHLNVPLLDDENYPASLSKRIINGYLKDDLDFKGLVITDALNMKGAILADAKPGDIELQALLAGNDILLMSENVKPAIEKIKTALQKRKLRKSALDEKVRKILMAKHWAGLTNYAPIDTANLYYDLNNADASYLNYRLYEKSLTLLRNNAVLPLLNSSAERMASLVINDTLENTFQQTLSLFAPVQNFVMSKDASPATVDSIAAVLSGFTKVIISIHNTTTKPQFNFGITESMNSVIQKVSMRTKAIVVLFGNSYCLNKLVIPDQTKALIIAYEDTYLPQHITAQALFGAVPFNGRLPVSPGLSFHRGDGLNLQATGVIKYTMPAELNIDLTCLQKVDSIINDAIKQKAFPGCQVYASVDGKVIYNKSFGYTTYADTQAVENDMIYDIASMTKIDATALAAMWLYDHHLLDLKQTVAYYLPDYEKTNKGSLTVEQLMTHTAGLQAWIPFYKEGLTKNGTMMKKYFSSSKHDDYTVQITDSLFMNPKFYSKIDKQIKESPLTEKGKYVYSDLGMLLLQKIIERQAGKKMDVLLNEEFYQPLGLSHLLFNPRSKLALKNIVPTEYDTVFRQTLVHGYVHDPAAALFGGVAGNAGLFGNAQSVGVLMQMLLNEGSYAGKQYISKATVDTFTEAPIPGIRRGLVFDKPETNPAKGSPTCKSASPQTFGHQGFTGTCTWADPSNQLVYVFLSNRIFPSAANQKISKLSVRTEIQQVFYDCLRKVR